MLRIAFYPIFEDGRSLRQFIYRATWYLYPLRRFIGEIRFYATSEAASFQAPSEVDRLLDPEISNFVERFTELKVITASNLTPSELRDCDYVFVHSEAARETLTKALRQDERLSFGLVRVDHNEVRYADSFFLRFSEAIPNLHENYRHVSRQRIDRYLSGLRAENVYLFGTGPNLSFALNADFSDGIVIACNSMVVNSELIDALDPKLFVIADPIFHAGPSCYAGAYRQAFLEALGDRDCPVIVPLRDYHIYSTYFPPSVVARLVPVPFENRTSDTEAPKLNLLVDQAVTTTSNILTLFQLPLASTIGQRIYISGCDGRPLSQNKYFWSHNKSVQINDKMAAIREAHPAFFKISYDDYYETHVRTLEEWIQAIERKGQIVANLTPSHIPALQKRQVPRLLPLIRRSGRVDVSVIMPVYNAARYLEEAVKSVIDTCDYSLEILLIDDFSEDESLEVARSLEHRYDAVVVYPNFNLKGVSGARNTGISLARGRAVCFLDADDFVYPESLNKRFEALGEEDVQIVHSTVSMVSEAGVCLGVEVGVRRNVTFEDCHGNPASFNTLMFERSVLEYLHFEESITNGEDWLALARILRRGYKSVYVPAGKAAYRIHSASTVGSDFFGHEEKILPVLDWIFSPVEDACYPERFRRGLPRGQRETAASRRRLGQLATAVFLGDLARIDDLLDQQVSTLLSDIREVSMSRLKVPFVRCFGVPIDEAKSIPVDKKMRIAKALEYLNELVPDNRLFTTISDLVDLGDVDGKRVLELANRLFRDGEYDRAATLYGVLIEQDQFYRFLNFNLAMCQARIAGLARASGRRV